MVMQNTMMIDACYNVNYTSTMRSTIYIYIHIYIYIQVIHDTQRTECSNFTEAR